VQTNDLLNEKRDDILRLAAKHGALNVRVFGSFARGDADPDSDVDFLIDVGPNTSFFFPGGLLYDLEQLLGREVDVVTENGLHRLIKDRVLEEAVPL
jgi:predicted nucleotidyltransferase